MNDQQTALARRLAPIRQHGLRCAQHLATAYDALLAAAQELQQADERIGELARAYGIEQQAQQQGQGGGEER